MKKWRKEVRELYSSIRKEFDLDAEGRETLEVACHSLENFYQAKGIVDSEGMTYMTSTLQQKVHPAVIIMKQERAGYLSAMRALKLEWTDEEKPKIGRPSARIGI